MATNFSNPNLENQTQKHELDHTHLHRNTNPQTCSPWVWLHSRRYFTISQTHKHPPWLPSSPSLLLLHNFMRSTSLAEAVLEKDKWNKKKKKRRDWCWVEKVGVHELDLPRHSCSKERRKKKKKKKEGDWHWVKKVEDRCQSMLLHVEGSTLREVGRRVG